VYVRGLLRTDGRKSVEPLARQVLPPAERPVHDTAQALQNFVNQSPWDEQRLWRRLRRLLAGSANGPDDGVVVEDLIFPKRGRHSVGVQRQHSSQLGSKLNCQIAVAVYLAGSAGCFLAGLRLYLPRRWVLAPDRLATAGVPSESRTYQGRWQIALALLDELRREGLPCARVTAGSVYAGMPEFHEGLAARGIRYCEDRADADAASQVEQHLRQELGLDHFEGRSWRGFHHHACLVALAHGFTLWHDRSVR
jgi:SRSO17 transposase